MIPQEFIEEVLERTDIVEIIEPRVTLKKSGQNYTGLCPFHDEKSPSFSVSQDKQFYYCFGCQASGSALKFLMEFDRMDFVSSIEHLAQRVGLEVPRDQKSDPGVSQKRKSIYEVLDQSTSFFREQLKSHESRARAVDYLKRRGLSGEIARDFGVGYAPPGWDNLMSKLAISNADRQLLIDSGMLTEQAEEGKTYDRFRDRIMFPIRDLRGRTIAFGGRVLDDDAKPKYLNSPETDVFHKGRELYGLFEARKRVKKLNKLIVVEGYMDVVALAQHGVGYSVATLGTATSTDHIERMFRIVPQIVFCFDGDNAGRNAAWKALLSTLPAMEDACSAKFLFVPDGDDPDSLIRREGQEKFEARVGKAQGL
ncbi:MAG: DNA primase, partial [Gammaproteobacteria bacterium]|nr:DNA primase [Gammaproteobacteria bacterium]